MEPINMEWSRLSVDGETGNVVAYGPDDAYKLSISFWDWQNINELIKTIMREKPNGDGNRKESKETFRQQTPDTKGYSARLPPPDRLEATPDVINKLLQAAKENRFMISCRQNRIFVLRMNVIGNGMTKDDAINVAFWLIQMANVLEVLEGE